MRSTLGLRLPTLRPTGRWCALAALWLAAPPSHGQVDFAREVRPLLAARCFECHGPDKQKAFLRLDRRDAALAGAWGGDSKVILPGDGGGSPLVLRTAGLVEGEDRMPPEGEPLTEAQVDLLRRWIDEGASWPETGGLDRPEEEPLVTHWAYRPPVRPTLPEVSASAWCRDPLDRFVLARLEDEGLEPAPAASAETLLRRAALDLTGLPPTLALLDRLEAGALTYEGAVEELLASTARAEHRARHWLDLGRYADTNGYEKDDRRTAWRWRDWLIDAFEQDLSFDRFTERVLAGDLLAEATEWDRVATGFHRNTMVNAEGGTDPEEFRVAAVVDRVNTTASVWLGSTLACAQCHNHKYDPFSQREYYELYAFFDSTEDTGNALAPELPAPLPGQLEAIERLKGELADLELGLEWIAEDPQWQSARDAWVARLRELQRTAPGPRPIAPREAAAASGATLEVDGSVVTVRGPRAEQDVYTLELELPGTSPLHGLRLEALALDGDSEEPSTGPGRAAHGNFVLTSVELSNESGDRLPFVSASASFAQPGFPVALAIDDDSSTGWAVSDGGTARPSEAAFFLLEPAFAGESRRLRLTLRFESTYADHALGRFRLALIEDPDCAELAALPPGVRAALADAPASTDGRHGALAAYHRTAVWPAGRREAESLERVRAARDAAQAEVPTALVMRELESPRQTRLLERGSFLAPGEPVEPGVPAALNPWPEGAPRNRLGLARWLTDPGNPLVARVVVNRTWARLFGRGLVSSEDDLGTRGEAPTHPELLDLLALDLIEGGWSLRDLERRLVLSATYRQSSRVTPVLLERDPDNRLLARASRPRLEAEVVRDAALASAGLLDTTVGGPSVFPPQPEGIWASTYSGDRWEASSGPGRWRRGLYTFHKRTSPYPSFTVFDGTSRELACTRRPSTNTPLQALVLLNDPVYVEAAVGLARRILEGGGSDAERVDRGFRSALARRPSAAERGALLELLAAERKRFQADPAAAGQLLEATALEVLDGRDPAELAAWSVVAAALLNTDEFVTRG